MPHLLFEIPALLLFSLGLLVFFHTTWVAIRTPTTTAAEGVIVVLGLALDQSGNATPTYKERLRRGASLLRHPETRGILSGGDTGGGVSEAKAGLTWLRKAGYPTTPWVLEDASTRTRENIKACTSLLDGKPALLVTSRTHLARARDLARRAGWKTVLVAAEDRLIWTPRTIFELVRESIARLLEPLRGRN